MLANTAMLRHVSRELSDRELVVRFVETRDRDAFAVLQHRHGPMVLRVSQQLLRDHHAAEDVYQATFLLFTQKATQLRNPDALGPWLYGVAVRLARKCRTKPVRRMERPTTLAPHPADELSLREAEIILHEELAALSERYRQPLVLCYLEGKTRDEAATALGCPLGTLKDRLERGKRLLHARLSRRGVALSSIGVVQLLHESRAASTSPSLFELTCRVVGGEVPARVAALASGFTLTKLQLVATALVATLLLSTAVAMLPNDAKPADKKDLATPKAVAVRPEASDPLPPGAVQRLGSLRHRVPAYPDHWYGTPDGKAYLVVHRLHGREEIRRIDMASGNVTERWSVPPNHHVAGFTPDRTKALFVNDYTHFSGLRVGGAAEPKQSWSLTMFDLANNKEVWHKTEQLTAAQWKQLDVTYFSPDGKQFVGHGHFDRALHCFDMTGQELWTLRDPKQRLQPIGYTADSKSLLLHGGDSNDIFEFDAARGRVQRTIPTLPPGAWANVAASPDGAAIVVGTPETTFRVWDRATGKESPALGDYPKWKATMVAFARDGTRLVTGGGRTAHLREWPSGKIIRALDLGREGIVHQWTFSGTGERLEVLFRGEKTLHFYDLATGNMVPTVPDAHRGVVQRLETMPDGQLMSYGEDASVRTWNLSTGKLTQSFAVPLELNSRGFARSPDGQFFAVPGGDLKSIHIYSVLTGKQVQRIEEERLMLANLTYSPDGKWLVGWDTHEAFVRVWNAKTGTPVLALKAPGFKATGCTFSPDGLTFVVAGEGRLQMYDVTSWREQTSWADKVDASRGLVFSPDGRLLCAASDSLIRVFEVATRQERVTMKPREPASRRSYAYHDGRCQFSPDSRFLAWVGQDHAVEVWDVQRDALLTPFPGHDDEITDLTFSRDGRSIITSSRDSTILIWDLAGRAKPPQQKDLPNVENPWLSLGQPQPSLAYSVMRSLFATPQEAVAVCAKHLTPASPLDAKKLAASLKDLDDPAFKVRQQASKDIEALGPAVTIALEQHLKETRSEEVRERLEAILKQFREAEAALPRLRERRALELLEWIGNDEAKQLLARLSEGAAESPLTREAQAILARLRR